MSKQTMSLAAISEMLKGTGAPKENTNPLPSSADKAIPLYNKRGVLIGYIPIFDNEWQATR